MRGGSVSLGASDSRVSDKTEIDRLATAALLIFILIVAAYLRFRGLGASLWSDEGVSWNQSQGSFGDILTATSRENYPPLQNLFVGASMKLFGQDEWALRLPAAAFGVLNVLAVYWVGKMVGGRAAGLIAAILLALSGFHIWHSQEVRMYALLALNATLFAGTSLWYIERPGWIRAAACLISGSALLYAQVYGSFVWISIGGAVALVLLLHDSRTRLLLWVLLQAGVAASFVPWGWILLRRAQGIATHGFWVHYPTPAYTLGELGRLASGTITGSITLLLALAAVAAAIPQARERVPSLFRAVPITPAYASHVWLLAVWLVGPPLVGLALSLVTTPIFLARYLIGSLPAFCILAGVGLALLARGWPSIIGLIGAAALVAVPGALFGAPPPIADWRGASAVLTRMLPQDGCLMISDRGYIAVYAYYARRLVRCVVGPIEIARVPSNTLVAMLDTQHEAALDAIPPSVWLLQREVALDGLVIASYRRIAN